MEEETIDEILDIYKYLGRLALFLGITVGLIGIAFVVLYQQNERIKKIENKTV